jgi:hypothetical protein
MSQPKKHHFLPQFYLERFKVRPQTTKHPQILVTTKEPHPRRFVAAIHDTGCISDYHTIDVQDIPIDKSIIEKALSEIEGNQKDLLDRIISNKQVTVEDEGNVAFLLTLMHIRVPKYKRNIETGLRMSVESVGELMWRHGKLPPMPEKIRKLGLKSFQELFKIEIHNWIILLYMYDSAINSTLVDIIDKMSFNLVVPPEGGQFITGDTPVSIYHPNYDSIRPYGIGFLDKEIEVTFPLSPELMLFASWNADRRAINLNKDQFKEYNRRTVIMADQFIYSNNADDSLTRLISENALKEAGFRTDQIDGGEGMYLVNRFIPVTK